MTELWPSGILYISSRVGEEGRETSKDKRDEGRLGVDKIGAINRPMGLLIKTGMELQQKREGGIKAKLFWACVSDSRAPDAVKVSWDGWESASENLNSSGLALAEGQVVFQTVQRWEIETNADFSPVEASGCQAFCVKGWLPRLQVGPRTLILNILSEGSHSISEF